MALEEAQKTEVSESENTKPKWHYVATPRYSIWSEEGSIKMKIALPGVHKEDIEIKALKKRFMLRAHRDEVLYDLDIGLGLEIIPGKTTAKYEEGLLQVEMKRYNALDDAFDVKIE